MRVLFSITLNTGGDRRLTVHFETGWADTGDDPQRRHPDLPRGGCPASLSPVDFTIRQVLFLSESLLHVEVTQAWFPPHKNMTTRDRPTKIPCELSPKSKNTPRGFWKQSVKMPKNVILEIFFFNFIFNTLKWAFFSSCLWYMKVSRVFSVCISAPSKHDATQGFFWEIFGVGKLHVCFWMGLICSNNEKFVWQPTPVRRTPFLSEAYIQIPPSRRTDTAGRWTSER